MSAGWMIEAFISLGACATSIWTGSVGDSASLISQIDTLLSSGKAVTFAVNNVPAGVPLVGNHAYTVDAVIDNGDGTFNLRLRNPWGVDGAGNDGVNDGYVTLTAAQAFASY